MTINKDGMKEGNAIADGGGQLTSVERLHSVCSDLIKEGSSSLRHSRMSSMTSVSAMMVAVKVQGMVWLQP